MDYQKAALYSGAFEYESISDGQKKKEFWFNMAALATTVVVGIFCPPAGMALGGALGGYEMLNAAAGKDLLSGRELGTGERWFRFGTGALGVFGGVKGLTSFSKNISMVKGASSTKMEHVVKMMQNSGRSNYKNIMTQAKNLQTAQALLNEKASGLTKAQKVENFQNRIDNIRNKMPNSKLKNQGNMAVADVQIKDLPDEFIAHSKIHGPDSKGADLGNFSHSSENKIFESYTIDKFPRYNDTEVKILEDIASKIKDPNISGKIDLYTELPACQSCTNVILEFRNKFSNIELNIFTK